MGIEDRAQPCPEGLNEGWLCPQGLMGPTVFQGKGRVWSREMGVEMGPHGGCGGRRHGPALRVSKEVTGPCADPGVIAEHPVGSHPLGKEARTLPRM